MNSDRVKMLEQFAQEEPDNPFNLYALALEYLPSDQLRATELFELLLERHPDYIPAYYHAGNLFLTKGELEKGARVLKSGIERARQSGDLKALNEMQGLLDSLS